MAFIAFIVFFVGVGMINETNSLPVQYSGYTVIVVSGLVAGIFENVRFRTGFITYGIFLAISVICWRWLLTRVTPDHLSATWMFAVVANCTGMLMGVLLRAMLKLQLKDGEHA